MKVAIVILNWNGKQLLEQFLPSVVKYSKHTAQIVVADNASTDDSITYLKENFPEVKRVINSDNYGFARGYNEALKHIEADIFCILNNDVEVTPNWLDPIIDVFNAETQTAIIQPKILNYANKKQFDYAGAAGGYIDKYGFPYCRGRLFNTVEYDQGQYDNETDILWASGACLFIRSKVFNELHGFDPDFFAHMEEIDLCWRAKNLGYSIKYISHSKVYHVGGATLNATNPKKTYLNFRNSLYTLTKNAPGPLFGTLFTRLFLDGIAAAVFLLQLKPRHTYAVLKSHVIYFINLPAILSKRKRTPKRKNYDHTRSIVWQYFVNKKKTFDSL